MKTDIILGGKIQMRHFFRLSNTVLMGKLLWQVPLPEFLILHPIWKAFSTNPNAFQYAVACQLMHHQYEPQRVKKTIKLFLPWTKKQSSKRGFVLLCCLQLVRKKRIFLVTKTFQSSPCFSYVDNVDEMIGTALPRPGGIFQL